MAFEMTHGRPPFRARNVHALYRAIAAGDARYSKRCTGEFVDVVGERGFTARDPSKRLGVRGVRGPRRFLRALGDVPGWVFGFVVVGGGGTRGGSGSTLPIDCAGRGSPGSTGTGWRREGFALPSRCAFRTATATRVTTGTCASGGGRRRVRRACGASASVVAVVTVRRPIGWRRTVRSTTGDSPGVRGFSRHDAHRMRATST